MKPIVNTDSSKEFFCPNCGDKILDSELHKEGNNYYIPFDCFSCMHSGRIYYNVFYVKTVVDKKMKITK